MDMNGWIPTRIRRATPIKYLSRKIAPRIAHGCGPKIGGGVLGRRHRRSVVDRRFVGQGACGGELVLITEVELHGVFQLVMGVPPQWLVYFRENPILR